MRNKLKILHLLQSDHFSGAENVVCQIINMFKDENIEMAYCSQNGQIREALKERSINFYQMKRLCIKEAKRVIREYKPDIIHTHDVRAGVVAALVGNKAKLISHIHGNHESMNKVGFKTLLYLTCSRKFRHIFWVSDSALYNYRFHKKLSGKSSILYNIINPELVFEKIKQDKASYDYDLVYLGRLTYPKNPERLLQVIKLVISEKPSVKAAIVGTGDLLTETKRLAAELGIENNISFLGFQSNPLKILQDAKVMIMTSRFEGTPMCALEAMLLGVPIVSTPTDGLCEVVSDGRTGFLAEDNEKLANYIQLLLTDEPRRMEMSNLSTARAMQINDLSNYKNELLKVYYDSSAECAR